MPYIRDGKGCTVSGVEKTDENKKRAGSLTDK
jgi:hypothetical protein